MSKLYLLVFALCYLLGVCVGQIVQDGQCNPDIPVATNFDWEKFGGTWYELLRSDGPQLNAVCSYFEITNNGSVLNVHYNGVNENFVEEWNGTLTASSNDSAKFTLDAPVLDNPIDFWITYSDENQTFFSVAYSCQNINVTSRSIQLWVLGRTSEQLTDLMRLIINTHLSDTYGIQLSSLQSIDHSDTACYILPTFEPEESIVLPGQCRDEIPVQQAFNVVEFGGRWHQISSYYTESSTGSCARAEYALGDGVVDVLNSQVIDQTLLTITGNASVISNDGSAKLKVLLNVFPDVTVEQELWILATDYKNYAVSYSCDNLPNNEKRIYSWILSRERELSPTAQTEVNNVIDSILELNNAYYLPTDQSFEGCFFLPEPNDNPVVFRGQCEMNNNVIAMPNFDAVEYMGLWHNIELYPTFFQDGTCSNARYTLRDGQVDVLNTQVINETLDTINAVAVIASDDGSAKLLVTFPVVGTNLTVTTNYWVLDTNYKSYALVYSCSNVDDDNMQVGSWKLGRNKTLTAEDASAIDRVINTTNVLDQRYYQEINQTEEGCFFVPTPEEGVPVVFPGRCDPNLGMQNFNLSQFTGTWHEIQAYPKEEQTGECISHQYTIVSNSELSSISSSVNDNFLSQTQGRLISTDSTGRLTINITSGVEVIEIPFWIIDTNYNDYALAYACVDKPGDLKAVWSWKLSRTKQLSPAANAAINNAIANIDVLDNKYYWDIDQSEQTCITLPVIPPGQPIIIPGLCDTNIKGIPSFNPVEFGGRWNQISSYYTESSTGSCVRAEYALNGGIVDVLNSQVIDQTLLTIAGNASVISADGSGHLQVVLDVAPNQTVEQELWILATDYKNYAVSYSCDNLPNNEKRIYSWILSRERELSPTAQIEVNNVIDSILELNNAYYLPTDQSFEGCFFFPEPNDEPVVFRGQCEMNNNVTAMPNFDAAEYMGLWHNIELYPSVFQGGTCNNARYTLNAGQVDVFNTQVINQTLDTINAVAVLDSDDGSAKLLVTFPVVGTNLTVTTNYWVLDTNYKSYALVYSCSNIDDDNMQVFGWKLSRNKTLSAEDSSAIDNVTNNIKVLDQRYFNEVNQTEEGCFFVPTPEEGVPVVFPGRCDPNLGMQNFNLLQFAGTWYEIQAYPKEEQTGECISHQYTIVSNSELSSISSSVNDNFLSQTQGRLISTDNTGRLTISITSGNEVIEIPFWIIDTNYNDYALAYACVDKPGDLRAVWSWKLSRTKHLSLTANAAINNAIANIDVLDNKYYWDIDQSEITCSLLPTIPPGLPIIVPGQCDPNIRGIPNFNPVEFGGRWNQISSYYSESSTGSCARAEYALNGGIVDVLNSQVIDQTLLTITGNASVISNDGSGHLQVILNVAPNQTVEQELWILATDYENYAVSYSCENLLNNQRRIYSWILSRERELSPTAQIGVNNIVDSILDLNRAYYLPTDQSFDGCFFFPEPNDEPVVFRGQCEMTSATAMPNFDAVEYMGLWHNIELYPSVFQGGTCNNARYTLIDGQVDVFNTQVINQTLDTINAVAVLASDDGSAKLLVTFPVVGTNLTVTTNYWVLDTNYKSYALVYSCANVDDDNMQVFGWKLSRNKTLSAEDSSAIDNVTNNIKVLDQRYFNEVNQTEEGCFFVPTPEEGVPVVFPGRCDPNLGMQNFNLLQFAGTWYEIQAYPKEEQTGECISHQYTIVSNSELSSISSSVNDNFLSQTQGRLISTDNTGRLTISITSGNEVIEIPFWIIDTNYNDYALAYACVDKPGDLRAVWSWKLSRSKQLSAAANTAINNAIANIDVLDNKYYWNIDQSAQTCFELPVIPPGQPIVISGTCDSNIKGIPNFDPVEFGGQWNQISSYYSESSAGSCVRAEYALNGGIVDVLNSQVIDQTLLTITGNASIISNDGSGHLQVILEVAPNQTVEQELWILATDYYNYAVSYSCENLPNNQRRIYSWILSRERELSPTAQIGVNNIVDSTLDLNRAYYLPTDQSFEGCFFFPEPTDKPVVFRGQCENNNVTAMPNFDAAEYMGLWHNIELYPALFQDGTCSNARYTLRDGQVDVLNTQVINETLDTINAVAVPASDDGSGKLIVTFPVVGTNLTVSTNYWVLDTNYKSYALVYTCADIDGDNMQVGSWKLSRNKTLAAEDSSAIDQVINTAKVLDQRYYDEVNQTEEGCFFVPTPEEGVPVVFPGRCDPNLGMQNFNLLQFAGTWHEIQAYPKEEQTGECISHQYTIVSNSELSSISSSVKDNFLVQTQGRLISTDNTGRLTISITSGNEVIEIPFWIIDTDYNDYALAYACVDQPNDLKGVWSWKLSRTKQLSPTANAAINNAIANIDVLDNKYYWDIDQSEQTCITLPVIPPGQPIIIPGLCDTNIKGIPSFNPVEFGGRWYQISSYYSESSTGSCVRAEYALIDGVVDVLNSQVIDQTLLTITGNASVISDDGSGHLQVILNVAPNQTVEQELWILATDYSNYAVSYSCENLPNNQRRIYSWILSREREQNPTAQIEVNSIIASFLELNNAYYLPTNQSPEGCFYFPEVNPDLPVRFYGKCDESIPAVPNFNPVQYMGLWHDMRSYPEVFQIGTCQNANYELVGGVVDVLNTQVINQTLDIMTGIAVIASDDGSAKLNVTFNVGGINVSANYWVLATNYTSYALVYSCRQVDEEYYQVASWQLSRTKELTQESIAEMNAVIDQIPVLDDRYYLNRKQTATDCFYFPEPEPNTPVIFPGECDNTIAAISSFNVTQFAGVWHETAKYPYGPNDVCIDHRFELGSSSAFNHNSFHVRNQTLILVNNSTVNLTSDDGSGRLTIDIVVDGEVQTIPFWILDTDYDNYALAYGCRNLPNDYRQIYSWKLSRTRQPNNQSLTAFNSIISMSNIDVLNNKYFDTIQQTDEACFYLPDLGPNDPVTFIGQCNPNIPVVTNFNAAAYLGTWRLIETYYAEFQMGSCQTAHYSEGNDSVLVVNTQVINQTLDSIVGSAVPAGTDGEGKLIVTFPTSSTPSDYWILGTDYTSYALVYTCENIGDDRRRVWSWKMSRSTSLTPNATAAINSIVNSIDVLNDDYYQIVDNSDDGCFFYPEPNENNPVIFQGQCDTTISAMANFDAGRYLNIWYDIESYPAPFQAGTCNTANYTLNDDGSVRVENTQVVNQLLETWIGSAVIASDDGTAKLNVTFNINGINVTANYWVLDTDYDSYALVYSCDNITPNTRSVFSWKLSRYPTLSENATKAIDNIIDSVQVLDQKYFIRRGHTEEDCFYYPDNKGGDVILEGQCLEDSAVPAVMNFNTNLFTGRWYEISRFPSDVQQGECFTTQYDIIGTNTLLASNTFVLNESQFNSTIEATVSADGRGIISANFAGVPFDKVYILGIDYDDFALAYSCRNLTDNRKQIFSWILSRSQAGISVAAKNITNELISSNNDLWEGYYQPTGQDNDACFFYPALNQLPDVVVLPGPCPSNIRGVPQFNAGAYLGRWYETARYFARDQPGQCNRAEYSIDNATARVAVYNNEVLDRTLLTQSGFADIASNDGTGQLSVDFVVDGTLLTANYYILATDYTSFSLVYSCTNLTGGWRQVSSWKLSRNKTLSPNAIAAMDSVISSTQGLNEKYYQTTSQSDDSCFYIPYNYTDRAPRFRGQCEDITGVSGFDVQRYLGWWHEIESYPLDDPEAGECRSSEYEQDGDTYKVVDNSVRDNEGFVIPGTVTATPEGKLIRIMSNGQTQDIWVLATDYETYALLYACEQVDDEYRQVWSAKHSKTRSLSTATQNIMSPIIENNLVLYPQFYQEIDQSDDTCFHYPTIPDGEPIVIPGECDLSIPAVENLNINEFAGTWYQTARYDVVNGSSCVGSTFIVENSGNIQVRNVEVVDGVTVNTEGTATVTESSGLIEISLPNSDGDTTLRWYILETDYTSYAVAYNCIAIDRYRRQIRAWKLSRERTLPDESNALIEALITERQELYTPYFRTISQNENCPEPSSALLVKRSVIVLLLCAMFQWLL